jgi:hypothetical protein
MWAVQHEIALRATPPALGFVGPERSRVPRFLTSSKKELMSLNSNLSRSESGNILARLHTLRASLARARNILMHFKDDRIDRDKLEPAARRVDQLMNLFSSSSRDPAQGTLFVSEIQSGVEQVTNPKSADALRDAQVDIVALLNALGGAP